MRKSQRRAFSVEELTQHQRRIQRLIQNISQYSPSFSKNLNYRPGEIHRRIQEQRQKRQDWLFEENMKIIEKIETTEAKVDVKHFPKVDLEARRKRRLLSRALASKSKEKAHSQSQQKLPINKRYMVKDQEKIFEENMDIIEKIQTTEKKIDCWQPKVLQFSRLLHEKKEQEKRKQAISKMNAINAEFKKLREVQKSYTSPRHHKANSSRSTAVKKDPRMKSTSELSMWKAV